MYILLEYNICNGELVSSSGTISSHVLNWGRCWTTLAIKLVVTG